MGGCDGRQGTRSYYTEIAQNLPKDKVILTAGYAKYCYNKLDLGDIGGIPRVLDAGQCNDSYSLVIIALKLSELQPNSLMEKEIVFTSLIMFKNAFTFSDDKGICLITLSFIVRKWKLQIYPRQLG
jgi:hypothetical protein